MRHCVRPPRNPRLRIVTAVPLAPPVPGAFLRRRVWKTAGVCASVAFTVWVAVGAAAASAFICVSCSVLLAILNGANETFSSNLEEYRSDEA